MFAVTNAMSNEQINNNVYLNLQRSQKKVQTLEVFSKTAPMKRKNFSAEEINLLKRLIQKYRPYQIENKKTDSVNLGEKQRIWENITAEFNSHFPHGDPTSVKQLRKLWDNLKTRRKNELLRERLMDEEGSVVDAKNSVNLYDNCIKDNDSLDSVNASLNYHHTSNEVPYINGGSQHNWTLPIETVIVEDDETYPKDNTYKDVRYDDDEQIADKDSFTSSNRLNNPEDGCNCNQTKLESELREKKLKLILREEEALYNMKKEEQQLKNEIASVQLRLLREKRTYLTKKRKLQLQILEKQLGSEELAKQLVSGVRPETNGEEGHTPLGPLNVKNEYHDEEMYDSPKVDSKM